MAGAVLPHYVANTGTADRAAVRIDSWQWLSKLMPASCDFHARTLNLCRNQQQSQERRFEVNLRHLKTKKGGDMVSLYFTDKRSNEHKDLPDMVANP